MFCSGCGQAIAAGQTFCVQCGRAAVPVVPPVPGFQFQLAGYAGRIRALGIVWLIYGGLTLVLGFAGLAFAGAALSGRFGPWMHGPMQPRWMFPALLHLGWLFIAIRAALAFAAGWGLMERGRWGRPVAIVAAILNLLHFPLGTGLGIWTLAMLLGYRNRMLHQQIELP